MSAQIPLTTFNEYWDFFRLEAERKGHNQKEFMELCGLPKTRYNAFSRAGQPGGMNVTAHYAIKFMEGLRMTESQVEAKSGRVFSDMQRKALRRASWTDRHPDIIDALSSNANLTKKVRDWMAANASKTTQ